MATNFSVKKLSDQHLLGNYKRFPIAISKGKGMYVWDESGNKYLDFVAGIAVDSLGHCHPEVVKAIKKQVGTLMHVSNLYHIPPQAELARELTRSCFADKAFFCNSGTEANEAAIKLARKVMFDRGQKKRIEIVTTLASFHGRTLGALSATGQEKMKVGFGPMLPGFKHVPFADIKAMEKAITSKTCAVMIEPLQGETGVNTASKSYFQNLRKLCNKKKVLLILDEVQTGMGRTGQLFAHQGMKIKPDIMTLAKGLGGGMPIGAMLTTDELGASLGPGTHGTTFGGNPLACAAALAVTKIVSSKTFLKQVSSKGDFFQDELKKLGKRYPVIKQIRGEGLMIGVDLTLPSPAIAGECLKHKALVNAIAPNTLRFIPPLIVTRQDISKLITILEKSISKVMKETGSS
ncbi:MAG: acetylornithine transaminase [Candidatus Nitronauta litoralis]|uniref:Acetylornithine aminotransferase n=1 Tax=Candidatus Nitronauta litoralis TaxID=2705533 RepID=A0A7T0FZ49_9BACT|nr:MAG: acetylornithine transaminase [Candidatus Nitronauta litoralis]